MSQLEDVERQLDEIIFHTLLFNLVKLNFSLSKVTFIFFVTQNACLNELKAFDSSLSDLEKKKISR